MSKKKDFIAVVIPAFNEEKKIAKVVNEVARWVNMVVVINDGSIDQTAIVVKNRKAKVISHLINLGQGAALQTGFDYVKQLRADVVVTFDADGQFKASEIPKVVKPIINKRAEVVLGSRFLGKVNNIPALRLVILKLGIFFTKVFSGVKLTDVANGFRAFSKEALEKIELKHDRWAHLSEIVYLVGASKLNYVEIPVTVFYTKYSTQKGRGQPNSEAIKIPFSLITKALLGT